MKVSDLGALFGIEYYDPDKQGTAEMRLVNGEIFVRAPFQFRNEAGSAVGAIVNVNVDLLPAEATAIKTALATAYQRLQDSIESEHGWVRWND